MTAPSHPVYASQPAVEPDPRRARRVHPRDDDDLIGWSLPALVLAAGLAWLFSPFTIHAIVISVAAFVLSIVLFARDVIDHQEPPGLWVPGAILLFPVALLCWSHARRRWGSTWLLPYAAVALVALGLGVGFHKRIWPHTKAARVTVSCRAAGQSAADGYLCTPYHVSGFQNARACWDLTLSCENGTRLTEHVCAQVVLGEIRESSVPFEYSPGVDDCDKIAGAAVEGLRVEIDPR